MLLAQQELCSECLHTSKWKRNFTQKNQDKYNIGPKPLLATAS